MAIRAWSAPDIFGVSDARATAFPINERGFCPIFSGASHARVTVLPINVLSGSLRKFWFHLSGRSQFIRIKTDLC